MRLEEIVPVVVGGAEALDARVENNHVPGYVLPGRIGIETAVDLITLPDKKREPARIWSGP